MALPKTPQAPMDVDSRLVSRHMRFGWWSLVVFVGLGITLETLHGFKIVWYLGVNSETRRLMWTLAHSHGTLLSVLQIVFALTVPRLTAKTISSQVRASMCLLGAGILMPLGFFLGGLFCYSGDPGIGILLVPPGGLLLLIGVASVAWCVQSDFR
jgi:hypothetical protein